MSKVFISRADASVSWGFRLQGGLEYNEPLTVTNVSVFVPAREGVERGNTSIISMLVCRCISINHQEGEKQG